LSFNKRGIDNLNFYPGKLLFDQFSDSCWSFYKTGTKNGGICGYVVAK